MLAANEPGKFKPPSDFIETESGFVVRVEIAAMQAEGFRLSLLNRKLVVSGERQLGEVAKSRTYHQVEIETGVFRLEYRLPKPVDETQVTAQYQNGILHIQLPHLPSKSVQVEQKNIRRRTEADDNLGQ